MANRTDKAQRSSLLDPNFAPKAELRLLPAAAIYGANAAGKSNILLALDYFQDAVMFSHGTWEPSGGTHLPQHGSEDTPREGSHFELEFVSEGAKFRYGFETDGALFTSEWLYKQLSSREALLFRRTTTASGGKINTEIKLGDNLSGGERYLNSIKPRVRENSLFLSAAAQENQTECKDAFDFITSDIRVTPLNGQWEQVQSTRTSEIAFEDKLFKNLLVQVLRAADPAIVDIKISQYGGTDKQKNLMSELPNSLREILSEGLKYDVQFVLKGDDGDITLPFGAESRGVRKIYSLAGAIMSALRFGDVFVIDELEASMHPHIARLIVDLFQDPAQNPNGAQLIFVTHDTNLLDQELLRRDQIWFVEKSGIDSHLYSLLEFSPRPDEDLERGYLRGRYGAIPSLRRFDLSEEHLTKLRAETSG